jgi:hypothetical protein
LFDKKKASCGAVSRSQYSLSITVGNFIFGVCGLNHFLSSDESKIIKKKLEKMEISEENTTTEHCDNSISSCKNETKKFIIVASNKYDQAHYYFCCSKCCLEFMKNLKMSSWKKRVDYIDPFKPKSTKKKKNS